MATMATQVQRADGRIELVDTSAVEQSPLYNEDLAPVSIARRNWTKRQRSNNWTAPDLPFPAAFTLRTAMS